MSKDEFTKLFAYAEEMWGEMNDRFDKTATKKQVDDLTSTVDNLAGIIRDYQQEMIYS